MSHWDTRYDSEDYFYGTEPNAFLRSSVTGLQPGRALCLGDGEGRNGTYLAELGFDVTSVDGSRVGIQKTRKLAAARGVEITTVVADLADFKLGTDEWDLIVSIFVHVPSDLRRKIHRAVAGSLKSGGQFVLEAYTPDQLRHGTGGPRAVDWLMTRTGLESELAGLTVVHAQELEREVDEGPGHTGHAAVVQLIGRCDRVA
jgi:SAM-dependent methyltransferase